MSIHQKFIKYHHWLSSTFYTYMEVAVNLPIGTILAKFIEPTTPGTQLNISEGGAGIALKQELSYRLPGDMHCG